VFTLRRSGRSRSTDPGVQLRPLRAHYGVVALPCRVGDPDRKGKVESAISHTQTALKGLRFETLEAAQAYLDRWDTHWADTRIHGTTTSARSPRCLPRWLSQEVAVQWNACHVRLLDPRTGQLLREHRPQARRGRATPSTPTIGRLANRRAR
jgi:hypothetical protein